MGADCTGKTCTCGVGPWTGAEGSGLQGGRCENCNGTSAWVEPQLSEADVRRIVREELVDLSRRLVNTSARALLPHA